MQFQPGTVHNTVKTMQLQNKWSLKQQEMKKNPFMVQWETSREDQKMAAIISKIKAGKKLSIAEKEYLRVKNPQLLKKVEMIEQEREAYEKELADCETKEEAKQAHQRKIQELSSQMNAIDQSGMSPDAKLMAMDFLTCRMAAINDAFHTFVAEGGLAKLPSEADLAREAELEQEIEEAREARLKQETEAARDESARETKEAQEEPVQEASMQAESVRNESAQAPPEVQADAPEGNPGEAAAKGGIQPDRPVESPTSNFTYTANAEKKPDETPGKNGKGLSRLA